VSQNGPTSALRAEVISVSRLIEPSIPARQSQCLALLGLKTVAEQLIQNQSFDRVVRNSSD